MIDPIEGKIFHNFDKSTSFCETCASAFIIKVTKDISKGEAQQKT
jgi:uncharacterized protein (DUF983 family)